MFQPFIRRSLLLVGMLAIGLATFAAVVKGTVKDEAGEGLPDATVRLLTLPDSAFVRGVKTNLDGVFDLSVTKKGRYLVEISYIGYETLKKDLNWSGKNVNLGDLFLSESSIMLKDIVVTGVKTQIKVMEDTVEYNADSYKTQPNAVVEDLLKRLPGVEVDSEGKITANGKEVKKILIDGKEFFSDDPKVASKNLPVNMVDKLQVVDRKSDLARLTGVDDGEDETVINLTVKKGMQNGWFGNAEAGYGTDSRYMGSFNINRFWDGNQVTLLGNLNNINELGFTDSNGNRFRRFGGDNGITESKALGINFNVGNKEIFRIGGDVMYSYSDRNTRQTQERQYLFQDSTSYSSGGKWTEDKGHNLRADFRMEWKPDSFNTLELRPRISWNRNDSESLDSTLTRAGDAMMTPVSNSYNTSRSKGDSFEFGMRMIYSHNFKRHRGRSFSVMVNYDHSNVTENEDSYSRNLFYLFNDSLDIYDQWSDNHTWSNSFQTRLTWTEPLGNVKNGNFLTLSYNFNYRWNDADRLVYDHPILGDGTVDKDELLFNEDLSNRFRNESSTQNIRLGFKRVHKDYNLDVGFSLVPSMSKSLNLINDAKSIPERNVFNYAPFMRFRYKFSKSRSLNIHYNGRSSQPSMSQLQPVPDMSNPMNIIVGNPELKPTFRHSLMARFQDFNMESQRSIMSMLNFNLTQNAIVSRTTFDPSTSAQVTTYNNVNGVWNAWGMMMVSMPFRNKAWQWSNHLMANANHNVGFNDGERNKSTSINIRESMGIAFRPDNMEFELRPEYGLQTTHNSLKTDKARNSNMTVHSYGAVFNAYYRTPVDIILSTDLRFTGTSGYSEGYDTNQWMWNASISYEFLKSKSLTVALKAYDLLQQKKNIRRNVTANYIDDLDYNSLTRYFMVTVSYRFNTFGKGKEPVGRQHRFGPGGPHPGGRPGGPR